MKNNRHVTILLLWCCFSKFHLIYIYIYINQLNKSLNVLCSFLNAYFNSVQHILQFKEMFFLKIKCLFKMQKAFLVLFFNFIPLVCSSVCNSVLNWKTTYFGNQASQTIYNLTETCPTIISAALFENIALIAGCESLSAAEQSFILSHTNKCV